MAIPVATAVFHFISFLLLMHTLQTFQLLVAADILPTIQRRLSDDPSAGFINIDCGLAEPGPVYNPETGLYYTSDEKYISTGINYNISAANHSYSSLFSTLRSFPEGRRNCYSLSPLKPNHTYLIRAQFLYGNYDGMNSIPAFDVYIGVNLWFNLTDDTYYKEIIHVATTNSIHVCLVNTGHGTPYINSLELRPLDINSPYPASPASSLSTWYHNDFGGLAPDTANYHLKDDVYDRLWYRSPTWSGCKVVSATNVTFDASQGNPCKVPISVLMNACEQNDGGTNWTLGRSSISAPTSEFYFYWHFAELELLGSNDTREFNIFLPYGSVRKFGPITPKYLQVTTIASPKIYLSESTSLIYTLEKTNESNRYPILNAVELYMVLELPASPTNPEDVDAVTAIKDQYVIPKIWQGDPCLPIDYQWDGLNCSYGDNNPPRITSLNLSNNGLTGKIPEFLANLPLLNIIDLTGNNLMGPVPPLLAEKAHNKSMDLRLQWNPDVCKSYPCEVIQVNKKRHHFIIPVVTSTVALVSLLAVIGIIFLAFKWRKKPGFLAMWWRRGEKERDTNAIGSTDGLLEGAIQPKNKRFNSSKIAQITDNFREVLGKGGFGKVYYGVLEDGTKVAVKVLNNTLSTITLMKQFCAEAEPLMRIHHVNLVTLIGYCDELANMALVYEDMSCGDLHSKILEKNENPLSWPARLQISVDAAQGLKYLHSDCRPPIIHRDIKPENILLDETGHAKIADFGISRFFTTDSQGAAAWTDFAGTRGYLDPECYYPINPLSEKSDVYAFGIVLLQLLTGQPALIKNTNHEDEGDVNVIDEIVDWVLPKVESGDILAIIDKRLQGDSINVDSAWKFLEIALECVKRTGNERPRMSKVVADLEACYALVEYREQNSSQGLGTSFVSTLPIPR